LAHALAFKAQVRGLFGGGDHKDGGDNQGGESGQGGNVQTASYASSSEKKTVTRTNATSDVRFLCIPSYLSGQLFLTQPPSECEVCACRINWMRFSTVEEHTTRRCLKIVPSMLQESSQQWDEAQRLTAEAQEQARIAQTRSAEAVKKTHTAEEARLTAEDARKKQSAVEVRHSGYAQMSRWFSCMCWACFRSVVFFRSVALQRHAGLHCCRRQLGS